MRSGQASMAALREQMVGLEERLAREIEQHQMAELQRREAELQAHNNLVLTQKLQDQISELTSHLQAEKEAKAVQVQCLSLYMAALHCTCSSVGKNVCLGRVLRVYPYTLRQHFENVL